AIGPPTGSTHRSSPKSDPQASRYGCENTTNHKVEYRHASTGGRPVRPTAGRVPVRRSGSGAPGVVQGEVGWCGIREVVPPADEADVGYRASLRDDRVPARIPDRHKGPALAHRAVPQLLDGLAVGEPPVQCPAVEVGRPEVADGQADLV